MARWLLKTEPNTYSFSDLQKDKRTTWDGVSNPLALKHLRSMKKGDHVLIYHTGAQRQAVGIAEVTSNPYPDPKSSDPKLVVIDLKSQKPLKRPIPLSEFKSDQTFQTWDLLRLPRLSILPIPDPIWTQILVLSNNV